MAYSVLAANSLELAIVGLAIFLGACVLQMVILTVRRWLPYRPKQSQSSIFKIAQALPKLYNATDENEKLTAHVVAAARLTLEPRGVLSTLPLKDDQLLKASWQLDQQRCALRDVVIAGHNENRRSTYLGLETFRSTVPSARLFGWGKPDGQNTIFLGQIASLEERLSHVGLRVVLHPEDAQKVKASGWGKATKSTLWETITGACGYGHGAEVLLSAPRNKSEAEQVTKVVLNASIWWMAGIDDIEDV